MGYIKFKTTCNNCKAIKYFYFDFGYCTLCKSTDIKVENIRSLEIDLWSDEGKKLQEDGLKNCIKIKKEE